MRQLQVLIIIILSLTPVNAAWQAGADLRCLDSAFIPALRVDAEFSYSWDDIRITVPLRYSRSFSYDLSFFETGAAVSVYPLEGYGLFIGASVFRGGVFAWIRWDDCPDHPERVRLSDIHRRGWRSAGGSPLGVFVAG